MENRVNRAGFLHEKIILVEHHFTYVRKKSWNTDMISLSRFHLFMSPVLLESPSIKPILVSPPHPLIFNPI